jgi:hypothetical protein
MHSRNAGLRVVARLESIATPHAIKDTSPAGPSKSRLKIAHSGN